MNPLGNAIKIALDTQKPAKQVIDELLVDYSSIPNMATGLAQGDMMLHGDHRSSFNQQKNPLQIAA